MAATLLLPGAARVRSQAQEPPVFPAAAELVRVDVTVLDRDGQLVTGLSRDDFTVEEDGRTQVITSFEPIVVRRQATPPAAEAPSLSESRLRAPSEGRAFFFFFDDIHVSPDSAESVRTALRRFVETDLRDGDWVTIMTADKNLWWTARNTWEYHQLPAVIGQLAGRGTGDGYNDWEAVRALEYGLPIPAAGPGITGGGARASQPPPGGAGAPPSSSTDAFGTSMAREEAVALVRRRTGMTLGALTEALGSLTALRGQKSLVLISEGFILLPKMHGYDEAIDLARRANVAIHFLNAHGLETGMNLQARSAPTGMPGTAVTLPLGDTEGIAEVTGGRTFATNDPGNSLHQVAAESEAYYLLGYVPARPGGGERKVRVRMKQDGLTVRARTRYFVPDAAKAAPAPTAAVAAMRSLADTTDLPMRTATLFFEGNKSGEVSTMLATEVAPPAGKRGKRLFKLTSEARARDGGQPVLDRFEGSPEVAPGVPVILSRQWFLPSGVWQVRLLAEDTVTGKIGTAIHTFEVPDPKAFRLSTPILTSELNGPGAGSKLKVALGRGFHAGSVLYCQYSVYGAARAQGSWSLSAGDRLVREAPFTAIQPGPDGRLIRTLGLSLQGMEPADYRLTLSVKDEKSGDTVVRTEPFTVVP